MPDFRSYQSLEIELHNMIAEDKKSPMQPLFHMDFPKSKVVIHLIMLP